VIEADRAHVWHHLIQHKPFETTDPRIIVEGKGMRVWDQKGKEHLDAVSGGVWTVNVGYGREHRQRGARPAGQAELFRRRRGSIPGRASPSG
jgi:taurine-pyruvate aminotransferase